MITPTPLPGCGQLAFLAALVPPLAKNVTRILISPTVEKQLRFCGEAQVVLGEEPDFLFKKDGEVAFHNFSEDLRTLPADLNSILEFFGSPSVFVEQILGIFHLIRDHFETLK
ncbi:hypothetical protein BWQ96_09275 [Gracilariopsis chorda]|uniref:Uncharacterized protein n=1 Tax=Gracilariopsis chorda TaxID=448386 RepID=A0A2V3IG53_9FLOR|nr:hypothetical protein BWQ96_09275 [Gracilariopsis chorda]|eukprot:PXF41008.1 hypothetical protein BWQ96_09275 [Gracilariopsis chorda]